MNIEPAVEIFINQLFGQATSDPETKAINTPVRINIVGCLLMSWIMPRRPFRNLNRLPYIGP
ncbi:hypothetical protein DB347_22660 [Opitutaceae bacterium EW11]|nr:hypothetical protein DB347_22660 [Opitutaceae bacterium EW11]